MVGKRQPDASEGRNEYALVTYVPPPLGAFVDDLREELAPRTHPGRAHVTLLQPRPLSGDPRDVERFLRARLAGREPFPIEATGVRLFPETGVVFLAIGEGSRELLAIHRMLNRDGAAFEEPYPFEPHITLAAGVTGERLSGCVENARREWEDFAGARRFLARRFHFVQNTRVGLWMDLAALDLSPALAKNQQSSKL